MQCLEIQIFSLVTDHVLTIQETQIQWRSPKQKSTVKRQTLSNSKIWNAEITVLI